MSKHNDQDSVAVEYIGPRAQWLERKYKSNLTFTVGQVRHLPADLARKLLRHADLFALAKHEPVEPQDAGELIENREPEDDTAELLEKAAEAKQEAAKELDNLQGLRDQVMHMEKESLEHFARVNYRQELDRRRSVAALREQVLGFIDQFGAV